MMLPIEEKTKRCGCLEKRGKEPATMTKTVHSTTAKIAAKDLMGFKNKNKSKCSRQQPITCGRSPPAKCYVPSDFTERTDRIEFQRIVDETETPAQLLRREIDQWRRKLAINDKIHRTIRLFDSSDDSHGIDKETAPRSPSPETAPKSPTPELPSQCDDKSDDRQAPEVIMMTTVDARMEALENYFERDDQYRLECSISSDTLEALENAERLVCEAKRTILEAKSRSCCVDNILQQPEALNYNDELLEIKSIVAAKFDEANGRKSKFTLPTPQNTQAHENSNPQPERVKQKSKKCKKCLTKKQSQSPPKPPKLPEEFPKFPNISIQRGPKIDIKNTLSLTALEKLDIPGHSSIPPANTGNFQLRHESSKRVRINGSCSLIDTGVQTSSLRDGSKFDEPVGSRSCFSDLDQNKIDKLTRAKGINDKIKINECQGDEARIINHSINKKLDFMDFLMGINDSEMVQVNQDSHESNLPISSLDFSFDSDVISLKTPDTANVDKIINNIDKKLKIVNELTESFQKTEKSLISTDKIENSDFDARGDVNSEIKILLSPRSRISSSSSSSSSSASSRVSSDLFQSSPERFSTPLNNWKIDGSAKLLINDEQPIASATTAASEPLIKHNDNHGIVPITRNNLSTPVVSEKNSQQFNNSDEIVVSSRVRSGDTTTGRTASIFPSYSPENGEESEVEKNVDVILNNENKMEECKIDDKQGDDIEITKDEKIAKNSGNFCIITQNSGNNENLEKTSSSARDATSRDISKLSSEILGSSVDDKKSLHSVSEDKVKIASENNGNEEKSGEIEKSEVCKDEEISQKNEKSVDSLSNTTDSSVNSISAGRMGGNSAREYSEGELFQPSSCAYSLGEVVMSANGAKFSKICVNLSDSSTSTKKADCSPGEVQLLNDIDSDSSGCGRGRVA